MSVELPEARILAGQMNEELAGKRVDSVQVKDHARLQKIGMMDTDETYEKLVGGAVQSVASRGNTIHVKLDNGSNLIIGPEYGGVVRFHAMSAPEKYHLRVGFDDGSALTVRLTSTGVINARNSNELETSYVYRRDFEPSILSPADEDFTFEAFSERLDANRMLKSVLVGKEAIVVGLSNSAFQDVIYRAKLHPKRKASELSGEERRALYDAIAALIEQRSQLNGKMGFVDLYGKEGEYAPAMGPNMKGQTCGSCGGPIEKLAVGGGDVYYCPTCQV